MKTQQQSGKLIAAIVMMAIVATLSTSGLALAHGGFGGGGGNFHGGHGFGGGGFHGGHGFGGFHGGFGGFGGFGGGWGGGFGGWGYCQSVPYWVAVHHGCYSGFF